MQIIVNGQQKSLGSETLLSDFLEQQKINTAAVAIAVNGVIVHREEWYKHALNNGDSLTIIQAVAGG